MGRKCWLIFTGAFVLAVGALGSAALAAAPPPVGVTTTTETTKTDFIAPATPIAKNGVAGQTVTKRRLVRGSGRIVGARFAVDFRKGPPGKVVFGPFHSLALSSIRFGAHRATIRGFGVVSRHRVHFTAIAIDNGFGNDVFRIAWAGGASLGGRVLSGSVVVR